ncbi:MAG: response regulator [Calothrix sp. SM1_5_4]|nr:response regulator [Calothrix sp. SM1_5_4]
MNSRPVLIVEDDPDIREMLESFLRDEGYRVSVAENGRKALDFLRGEGDLPGLILLDLMMPIMDGRTFMGHLLQDSRLSAIPVVTLTAANIPRLDQVSDSLRKPVNIEDLLSVVSRYAQA